MGWDEITHFDHGGMETPFVQLTMLKEEASTSAA